MKNLKSFVSGALAMVLALSLAGGASAVAGKLEAGTAGVVILDREKVAPSEAYTADGADIPAVVTWQDAAGNTHSYLPVELLAEYLGIPVFWSEKRNSVVLGVTMENAELEGHVYPGGKKPANPSEPELGQTVGPFTEIDPGTVNTQEGPTGIDDDRSRVQTATGFTTGGTYIPENGTHIVLTVTNNGQTAVSCLAGRDCVLGRFERFRTVDIAPGETLTRAFAIAGGTTEEQAGFTCIIQGAKASDTADVTVSLMQYK